MLKNDDLKKGTKYESKKLGFIVQITGFGLLDLGNGRTRVCALIKQVKPKGNFDHTIIVSVQDFKKMYDLL